MHKTTQYTIINSIIRERKKNYFSGCGMVDRTANKVVPLVLYRECRTPDTGWRQAAWRWLCLVRMRWQPIQSWQRKCHLPVVYKSFPNGMEQDAFLRSQNLSLYLHRNTYSAGTRKLNPPPRQPIHLPRSCDTWDTGIGWETGLLGVEGLRWHRGAASGSPGCVTAIGTEQRPCRRTPRRPGERRRGGNFSDILRSRRNVWCSHGRPGGPQPHSWIHLYHIKQLKFTTACTTYDDVGWLVLVGTYIHT